MVIEVRTPIVIETTSLDILSPTTTKNIPPLSEALLDLLPPRLYRLFQEMNYIYHQLSNKRNIIK